MAASLYYKIKLYFEHTIYKVDVFNNLLFLLHPCRNIVWIVMNEYVSAIIEGYTVAEESCRESQGEWSHNSQWMQEILAPIFQSN